MVSLLFKDGKREDAWVSSCPTSCPPSFAESKNLPIQLHFKLQFPFAINSLRLTAWKAAINDWHTHCVRDRPVPTAARTRPECKGACSSDVGGNRPLLALTGIASISSIIKVYQYFSVQVIWSHNCRWKHISENMWPRAVRRETHLFCKLLAGIQIFTWDAQSISIHVDVNTSSKQIKSLFWGSGLVRPEFTAEASPSLLCSPHTTLTDFTVSSLFCSYSVLKWIRPTKL